MRKIWEYTIIRERRGYQESVASEIYADKTGLIAYTNRILGTEQKFRCVSRPRRFGKSMAANMLLAYYDRNADTKELFRVLAIESSPLFEKYVNQ